MTQFLHYLFIRDWLLKVFSLALAVLTWLAVSFSIQQKVVEVPGQPTLAEQTYYDVHVAVVSSDGAVDQFKVKPPELDHVVVQGEKELIQQMGRQDIRAQVDLTGVKLTNGLMKRVQIITPAGVRHMLVQPDEVEIIPPPAPETKPASQ